MKVQRFAAGLLAIATLAAHAHAFLDHADPKVGSTVATAPAELRLWFSEQLEPAFSRAQVTDAQGRRVDTGPAQVDAHDRKLMHVRLSRLAPGSYTATWRAVSVDTHVSEGHFAFRVGP
jgi:copper resistance protein C